MPLWNAPSPLNGSWRSPKELVMGPSIGHSVGRSAAVPQSALSPSPKVGSSARRMWPESAELRSAVS